MTDYTGASGIFINTVGAASVMEMYESDLISVFCVRGFHQSDSVSGLCDSKIQRIYISTFPNG